MAGRRPAGPIVSTINWLVKVDIYIYIYDLNGVVARIRIDLVCEQQEVPFANRLVALKRADLESPLAS